MAEADGRANVTAPGAHSGEVSGSVTAEIVKPLAAFVAASRAGAPAAAAAMRKYVPRAHGTSARVSPEALAAPILAVAAALFAPDALEGKAAR